MNKVIAFLRIIKSTYEYHYCIYIGIKEDNKVPRTFRAGEYINPLDAEINVHGGITFDGKFNEEESIIPVTDIPKDWYTYHCYGSDLNHYCDVSSGFSRSFRYAKKEVIRMKEQMEALLDQISPLRGNKHKRRRRSRSLRCCYFYYG